MLAGISTTTVKILESGNIYKLTCWSSFSEEEILLHFEVFGTKVHHNVIFIINQSNQSKLTNFIKLCMPWFSRYQEDLLAASQSLRFFCFSVCLTIEIHLSSQILGTLGACQQCVSPAESKLIQKPQFIWFTFCSICCVLWDQSGPQMASVDKHTVKYI